MRGRTIEDKLVQRILPKLEKKLGSKLEKRLIRVIEGEYPSESQFKPKFIREVRAAQKRTRDGKGRTYTYEEFKRKFLPKAKR